MNDLISREDAIKEAYTITIDGESFDVVQVETLEGLPTAWPERLTDDDFETIRIHLNACKEKLWNQHRLEEAKEYQRIVDRFMAFASAQPEPQWIPCSEQKRLPNYREPVLISTYWGVRMAERDAIKEDGTDDFWYLFLDDATARPRYVYAWMPLPKPYKGGNEL